MEDVTGVKGAVTHLWMLQPKTCVEQARLGMLASL